MDPIHLTYPSQHSKRSPISTRNPVSAHSATTSGGTLCSAPGEQTPAFSSSGSLRSQCEHTFKHIFEGRVDVVSSDRTGLFEETAQLLGQSFPLGCRHYLIGLQIALVADYYYHHILHCVFSNPLDPSPHTFEGRFLGHVVDHKGSLSFSVVADCWMGYAEVMALYCSWPAKVRQSCTCVPDLNLDATISRQRHHFRRELYSHSRSDVFVIFSAALDESIHDVGLANEGIASEDHQLSPRRIPLYNSSQFSVIKATDLITNQQITTMQIKPKSPPSDYFWDNPKD